MKNTKRMLAALMSAVMLGTCSAVPDVTYAETDTSVPFMVTIDNPKLTKGFFAVMFKKDYSKETIENTLIPELINTTGKGIVKDIKYFKTYYNADNGYTTDPSSASIEAEYILRDAYIVELAADDKETALEIETAFSDTGYFHYIDAVNFFRASDVNIPPDDESLPFEAKPEDNFIANRLAVMFKGKYSKEELEKTVIPELKEINGVREFRYMSTGGKGRTMYIIDLDFERDDKESAYNTAKTLYDTGYFYCVEMNMIPNADMQTTTRADIAELPAVTTTVTTASENFKSMTLDEAITAMSGGEYAWMSGVQPELLPVVGATYHGYLTIGKDNKIHNIQLRKVLTRIKVKVGKELPYDDIKAAVEANGMIMPVIRKNGNDYEITSAATKECYYYTLDLIKKCPEVTAIDMQYKLCEDKVNYIQFGGIYYNGEQTAEELIAKYPELELTDETNKDYLGFTYNGEKDKLYDFFCRVRDNGDCLRAGYVTTELAALNEEYFYCNEPVLIDGTAGDANIDGYVDISDSVMIMQSIANPDRYGIKAEKGITAQGTANGDTDENGLTNMDSLEIQKSLLGMGSIPIPPKDKDINLVSYDPIDFTEEYDFRSVTIDEKKFDNSGVTASKAVIGNEIGDFETVSAENGNRPAKVYEIKNITPEYAVAVQYEGSNNYYVYRYIWYIPQTIGQLLTDLDLENQLTFLKAHYEGHKPHYERSVALAYSDKDKIWNTLFSDKDAEVSRQDITKWPSNRKAELSISCETPLFGRTNFGIRIHENGYISTNIVDGGMGYYIDAEKAQELISLYASAE